MGKKSNATKGNKVDTGRVKVTGSIPVADVLTAAETHRENAARWREKCGDLNTAAEAAANNAALIAEAAEAAAEAAAVKATEAAKKRGKKRTEAAAEAAEAAKKAEALKAEAEVETARAEAAAAEAAEAEAAKKESCAETRAALDTAFCNVLGISDTLVDTYANGDFDGFRAEVKKLWENNLKYDKGGDFTPIARRLYSAIGKSVHVSCKTWTRSKTRVSVRRVLGAEVMQILTEAGVTSYVAARRKATYKERAEAAEAALAEAIARAEAAEAEAASLKASKASKASKAG